jgi:hypothetical protein
MRCIKVACRVGRACAISEIHNEILTI